MWSSRVKPESYLQRGVKDDQFGAGGHGVVTGVFLHEVHIDLGSRLLKLVIPAQAEEWGLWGWARPRPVLPQAFELTVPGFWGWELYGQLQATCAGAHSRGCTVGQEQVPPCGGGLHFSQGNSLSQGCGLWECGLLPGGISSWSGRGTCWGKKAGRTVTSSSKA